MTAEKQQQQLTDYVSLQEALRDVIDILIRDINKTHRPLNEYEIEVRFGQFQVNGRVQKVTSLLNESEYIPLASAARPYFETDLGAETFYRAAQRLTELGPLCCSVSELETSSTVVVAYGSSNVRYTVTQPNAVVIAQEKQSITAHANFVGATHRKMEKEALSLRLAASYEKPCGVGGYRAAVQQSDLRLRERRSFYLYDTGTLASENEWASKEKIEQWLRAQKHGVNISVMPRNPWRIDMTRVGRGNDEFNYQIELELDLEFAWQLYRHKETLGATAKRADETDYYFKHRVLSTLAECIFRVQHAIVPTTPLSWLRQL